MNAKVLYLNWHKLEREQRLSLTLSGDFVADRPDLYDYVADFYVGSGTPPHIDRSDEAFRKFNRVFPGDMEGLKIRSMCVGDIVAFPDGTFVVCQGLGWKMLKFDPEDSVYLAFLKLPKVDEQVRA